MHKHTSKFLRATLATLLLAGAAAAQAAFIVGGGGGAYHGIINLAGDDLVVNGPLDAVGATFIGVGSVRINAGGSISAANAYFEVSSGWHNAAGPGAFTGQGSTVAVVGGGATAFTGSTTFGSLRAVQAGQVLNFAPGTEQQVGGTLTLGSVSLQGQGGTAFLTLLPGGGQQIGAVQVDGVDASRGQRLAPGTTASSGGGAPGWFALPFAGPVAVPTLGGGGALLLATLLGLLACAAGGTRTKVARKKWAAEDGYQ